LWQAPQELIGSDHCGFCFWSGSSRGAFILDLRSVHKPVLGWVKIAAHMKRVTIIPNHNILWLPLLCPMMWPIFDMLPNIIQKLVAFFIR
jgi:hypothetical protein